MNLVLKLPKDETERSIVIHEVSVRCHVNKYKGLSTKQYNELCAISQYITIYLTDDNLIGYFLVSIKPAGELKDVGYYNLKDIPKWLKEYREKPKEIRTVDTTVHNAIVRKLGSVVGHKPSTPTFKKLN